MKQLSEPSYLVLGLLVAICAVVLTWNLDDGLPYSPHPDETHTVPYTLPDGFNHVFEGFRYPGLAKRLYAVPRILAGWGGDAPAIVLAARTVSVFLALTSLVFFFLLLRSLTPSAGDWIALAGVLALACHHLFVNTARMAWAESLLLCCLLGYFIALLRFHRSPSTRQLLITSALLGLLVGAKYSGLFLLLPLVTSIAWTHRLDSLRIVRDTALAMSIFTLVFVITTPQLVVRPNDFIADFLWNTQHYAQGHPGIATHGIASSYVRSLGSLTVLLGCFALPLWLLKDRVSFFLFVPWAIIYFVKLSSYRMAMGRNMLILLPILLIALAQAARSLSPLRPQLRATAALLVMALLVVPELSLSSAKIAWQERQTTLDLAHSQVNALIPKHASVWRSSLTPPIEAAEVAVGFFLDSGIIEAFERGALDFIVLSEIFIDGLKPGTYRYQEDSELIRRLEAAGELVLHVSANQELKGSGVLVYQARGSAIGLEDEAGGIKQHDAERNAQNDAIEAQEREAECRVRTP